MNNKKGLKIKKYQIIFPIEKGKSKNVTFKVNLLIQ